MKLSFSWKGFDYFNSSKSVFNPYCLNTSTDNFANHPKKLLIGRKRSFICNQCNYTSLRPGNLEEKNILVQSGEKPVACTRCDYSTSTSFPLKGHMMIHSREKPFSCNQCNYSFTRSFHLKTHMLIHSGEKLYSCSHCSLSCTTAGNLKDHVRTHSGEKSRFIVINATIQAP